MEDTKQNNLKLCLCGCGQPVKNEKYDYILNHNKRVKKDVQIPLDFQWFDKDKGILFRSKSFRLGYCCCSKCENTEIEIHSFGFFRKYKLNHHRSDRPSPNWKGGRVLVDEYWYLYLPNHPYATKRGYYSEHRKIVEDNIGRILKPEEQVHHINKNTQDNRIENLKLYSSQAEHMSKEHSPPRIEDGRICTKCKKTTTGFQKKNGKWYPKWFLDEINGGFLCRTCYDSNRDWKKYKKKSVL